MDLAEREDALGTLGAALADAIESKRPTVVAVTGEAGIGKTEFLNVARARFAEHRGDPVLIGYGRALGNSYEPFRDSLDDVLSESGEARSRGLQRALGAIKASSLELLREVPAVGKPVAAGVNAFQQASRGSALLESQSRSYLQLVRELALEAPLAMFLDDMHRADESSVDLLFYLSQRLEDVPVVLVVTFREEDLDKGSPLTNVLLEIRRYSGLVRIPLQRLSPAGLARMIEHELGTPPMCDLLEWIFKRSHGNPFFAIEYLGLLRDHDALVSSHEGVGAAEDILRELSAIPDKIEAVLQKRWDTLEEDEMRDEMRVLQVASVIGPRFSRDQMVALSDLGRDATNSALRALIQRWGLIRASEPPDDHQPYVFFHDLWRAYVANSLRDTDPRDFRALHIRCAKTFYDAGSVDGMQQIARHYHVAAHDEEALTACEKAARRLVASGGLKEALKFALWAVEHADALGEVHRRVETRVFLGSLQQELRQSHAALATLKEADRITNGGTVPAALTCELRIHLSKAYRMENLWIEARAALEAAADVEDAADARLRAIIGWFSAELDLCGEPVDLDACRATLQEALTLTDDPGLRAPLLGHLGLALLALEEVDAARERFAEALELARQAQRPDLVYEEHLYAAHFNLALLDLAKAREAVEAMHKVAEDAGLAKNDTYRYAGREAALSRRWDDSAEAYARFLLHDLELGVEVPQARDWGLTHPVLQVAEIRDLHGARDAAAFSDRLRARFAELSEGTVFVDAAARRYLRDLPNVAEGHLRPKAYVELIGAFRYSTAAQSSFNFYMPDLAGFRKRHAG